MSDARVEIFTDGACSGNPGPGGWGAVLRFKSVEKELSGGEPATTNNRMELMAAIAALEALKRPSRVELTTDSTYLRDGITRWIHDWKRRDWKTATKKPRATRKATSSSAFTADEMKTIQQAIAAALRS